MSLQSTIEWTDATWNPVTGCTEVSPGCDHCYAKTFAERFRGVAGHHFEQGFDLRLWPQRLELPLQWSRPRRIFVNSMSDLFHQDVPDQFVLQVFSTMARANWHTFQVLTKRPSRLARMVPPITQHLAQFTDRETPWPDHIWLGVSVETFRYRWRVDRLRQVPAAIRFISAEPLLGPLDNLNLTDIHWLITGGESGHGHRPCDPEWVRGLRDSCRERGVAFFFKQWGGPYAKGRRSRVGGVTHNDYPQVQKGPEFNPEVMAQAA